MRREVALVGRLSVWYNTLALVGAYGFGSVFFQLFAS